MRRIRDFVVVSESTETVSATNLNTKTRRIADIVIATSSSVSVNPFFMKNFTNYQVNV